MRLGWLRVSVVTAMIGVALASGYWVVLLDGQIDEGRRGEREFTESAWRVTVSLSELRAAQQSYVAAESERDFWAEQTVSHTETALTGLAELTRLATATGTVRAVEAASEAIGDLQRVDAEAREHVAASEEDLARALLLTDGAELGGEVASHVARALAAERRTRDAAVDRQGTTQARAFVTALGSGVLAAVALLVMALAGSGRSGGAAGDAAEETSGADSGQHVAKGSLLDLALTAEPLPEAGPAQGAEGAAENAVAPGPDLPAAAVICTDLGSLANASELPELLGRAATVLNATGMIVWVKDGDNQTLRPAIGHGYSQATLARLGAIPHDSENATASAYREARMHVVPADASGAGAIVAPLISSVNCFGVLSTELREGWEARGDVQSLTRIIAAQLATLVAPDAAGHDQDQRAQA